MRNVLITTLISIGLAGCGSSGSSPNPTPTPLPTPTNHNPAITSSTVIPAFGISQITGFSAQAVATDSDGDAVTYEWDLVMAPNSRERPSPMHMQETAP